MTDTPPSAAARVRELLMLKSGAERLAMGCAMFDDAKALALAGLRAQLPGADDDECRRRLLLRLYGGDLRPEVLRNIL